MGERKGEGRATGRWFWAGVALLFTLLMIHPAMASDVTVSGRQVLVDGRPFQCEI